VRELQAVHLRATPFHAPVGGTLQETNHADRWKAHEIIHAQDDGTLHHPVNHQSMLRRIDRGQARVIAFEHQPVGRDDAVKVPERGETDAGDAICGEPIDRATFDVGLELRRLTVGVGDHSSAQPAGPGRYVGRQIAR
jgi:hypothetical protein